MHDLKNADYEPNLTCGPTVASSREHLAGLRGQPVEVGCGIVFVSYPEEHTVERGRYRVANGSIPVRLRVS